MEVYQDLHAWGDTSQAGYQAGRVYQSQYCSRATDGSTEVRSEDPAYVGMHAVRIVGWGESDGVKYWHVANSWGRAWNGDDYFKVLRGQNLCRVEEHVCFAEPALDTAHHAPVHALKAEHRVHAWRLKGRELNRLHFNMPINKVPGAWFHHGNMSSSTLLQVMYSVVTS